MKIENMLDQICKYLVLLLFTLYIGWYVVYVTSTDSVINLPDWIVSLMTIVFMFFFRRAKKENKDE